MSRMLTCHSDERTLGILYHYRKSQPYVKLTSVPQSWQLCLSRVCAQPCVYCVLCACVRLCVYTGRFCVSLSVSD